MKRWHWVWLGAGLVSCAGTAQQGPLKEPKPLVVAHQPVQSFDEQGAFGEVPMPERTLMWARVAAPGRDLPVVGQLFGLGAFVEPASLLSFRLGSALSREVDLSRPVDVVFSRGEAGDAETYGVVAAGVDRADSFVGRIQDEFEVARVQAGRWRLSPKHPDAQQRASACELWIAAQPVGPRVVCGDSTKVLELLAPFAMAKGRASADRSTLHVEMPGRALAFGMAQIETQSGKTAAHEGESASERSGRELGERLVKDFLDELGGLVWEATLNDSSIDVSQELRFRKAESAFSVGIAGRTTPVSGVPEAFYRLPADSTLALYSEGSEPANAQRVNRQLLDEMTKWFTAEIVVPDADLARMRHAFERVLLRGQAWELAYGQDLERGAAALQQAAAKPGPSKPAQAALDGWLLVGLEDESQGLLEALRGVATVLGEKKKFAERKPVEKHEPSATNESFRVAPLAASSGLPKDALHVVIVSTPNPKYVPPKDGSKPVPLASTLHLIAAPAGPLQTWVAITHDEASAIARLRAVLSPDSAKTLNGDAELRQLATSPITGLGYASIAGLTGLQLSADSAQSIRESREHLSKLWALPRKGKTRIPLWITRENGAGSARSVKIHVRLQPDAVADLLQLAMGMARDEE